MQPQPSKSKDTVRSSCRVAQAIRTRTNSCFVKTWPSKRRQSTPHLTDAEDGRSVISLY